MEAVYYYPRKHRKQSPAIEIPAPAVIGAESSLRELIGKAAFFDHEGQRVAGRIVRTDGKDVVVRLAIPNRDGTLSVSDSETKMAAGDLEPTEAVMASRMIKYFEAAAEIAPLFKLKNQPTYSQSDSSKLEAKVLDYQNVVIEGYAGTFGSMDNRDRGGDYVKRGAFDATIAEFMKNPVMLINHARSVYDLAGSWSSVAIDSHGLKVRGEISNAPGLVDTRFKLVEGHLKTLSIGGVWYYADDGFGIEEATLYEISLVPVPMNPDALIQTRSITLGDCGKAFSNFWRSNSSLRTE